jgi:predicted transcriptional regulator
MDKQLHKAQYIILRDLRYAKHARYNQLLKPTGLESDVFKFHVRSLLKSGYIRRTDEGTYHLTLKGKEYANNLDKTQRSVQKQPKVSLIIIAMKSDPEDNIQFLCQQRKRMPFMNYWGLISGPVKWGESFEDAAARELYKQTALRANFQVKSFCRNIDYSKQTNDLLEDKLFVILHATNIMGSLNNSWAGGDMAWLTATQLHEKKHIFNITFKIIFDIANPAAYYTNSKFYNEFDY